MKASVTTLHPQAHRALVDSAGALRAQIADLQAELAVVEDELREFLNPGEALDGFDFRASRSVSDVNRVDWKAVAGKLNPSRQLVTAHTKASRRDVVRVVARKKDSR